MYKSITKTFELYHQPTGELLSDGLAFEDVPELHKAYEDLYGENTVVTCYRTSSKIVKPICTAGQAFKKAWIEYFGELQAMGNLQ